MTFSPLVIAHAASQQPGASLDNALALPLPVSQHFIVSLWLTTPRPNLPPRSRGLGALVVDGVPRDICRNLLVVPLPCCPRQTPGRGPQREGLKLVRD